MRRIARTPILDRSKCVVCLAGLARRDRELGNNAMDTELDTDLSLFVGHPAAGAERLFLRSAKTRDAFLVLGSHKIRVNLANRRVASLFTYT